MHFTTLDPRLQQPVAQIPFQHWTLPDTDPWMLFYRSKDDYLLRFPGLADYEVSADGLGVCAWPVPGVSNATVEHLHLNQVLPLALSLQGYLVLHASAVALDGSGIAFMAESGRGKSTLAASFATTGARFLTDDALHLEWVDGHCRIEPSHPSVRLWEDSQEALIDALVERAPQVGYTEKERFLAGRGLDFCDTSQVLRRVYFLGDGSAAAVSIHAVRPAEAFMELVKHSFLLDIQDEKLLAWHFGEITRLAELPIFYRLDYPRHYEQLPAVRAAIRSHAFETAPGELACA